ncbi:EAL and HDOD domain-containing protein [Endothiovibrio diazotrophicus]
MQPFYIGRQPIFDRELGIYAYELLFRDGTDNAARITDGRQATSEVVTGAFIDLGLERVVGDSFAFINCPETFFMEEEKLPFPAERVVFEVLEDVEPTAEVLAGLERLVQQGYRLALDDFIYSEHHLPLLKLAHMVKLELPKADRRELPRQVDLLRGYGLELLAEKVETPEEFEFCRSLGFDYFQGYFLSRPKVIQGQRLTANRLSVLQLLAEVNNPAATIDDLARVLGGDVTLSYRLLRLVNSAFFGLPKQVDSIRQAIVFLGQKVLKNWASLLIAAGIEDKPRALSRIAMIRARMCENIARRTDQADPDLFFTTGLFSTLDALMDQPMEQIIQQLPLSAALRAALLRREGPAGHALSWTLAYEQWHWSEINPGEIDPALLEGAFLEAIEWTDEGAGAIAG